VLTSRGAVKGRAAVKVLRDEGLELDDHPLDVTRPDSIKALAGYLDERYGRLDVLINNAGVLLDPRGSRVLDAKLKTFHDTLETNFFGPLLLAQALAPLMRKNRYGRIINLSSGLAQLSDMGSGNSGLSHFENRA
jgi:NAD(P)-dependent dehydrogenase (short-subunit alcohol dehydrogenase family)